MTTVTATSGQTYWVSSGQTHTDDIVLNGGRVVVYGGTANGTTVSSGGVLDAKWGVISGTHIKNGGQEIISESVTDYGAIVSSGGAQFAGLAPTAPMGAFSTNVFVSGTTILSGGEQSVRFGANASATRVQSGGRLFVSLLGTAWGTVVENGGTVNVTGSAFSTTAYSGFFIGHTSVTILSSGAIQNVFSSGHADRTGIFAGATQYVYSGGVATLASVAGGQQLYAQGSGIGGTVGSGGFINVFSGGVGIGNTITSGGLLQVFSGSVASSTTVSSGGHVTLSGGLTRGTILNNAGYEDVRSGGVASGTTVSSFGMQTVHTGGVASNTTISGLITSGQVRQGTQLVLSGGFAVSSVVMANGIQIEQGGTDSATLINAGASQDVSDGVSIAAQVYGQQTVFNKGVSRQATIFSGGLQDLGSIPSFSGGTASGTTISSGGIQFVWSSGVASGTTVVNGGHQGVLSGGLSVASLVSSGGLELVSSGGTASGTVIAGGTLQIAQGGVASSVAFSGTGGVLQINGSTMPTGVISGFTVGNTIDLAGVTYSAGGTAQLLSDSTLRIIEGANTYNLKLQTGVDYSSRHFQLGHDSGTGVLISVRSNVAPVTNATNRAATHNQALAASSLLSTTDADGDAIMAYQLWDSTADASSGRWVVGGVSQGSGVAIDITASQLAGTTFQSGSGSDDLYVRAYDGTAWSAWKQFNVNAPLDRAPVTTAANKTAVHGQTSIAASSLFSATDPDGDAITQYALWDTEGSGRWVVNGVNQATNAEIVITAAQLAQTRYVFGSATDHLYVRAFDGTLWGNWTAFTASPFANTAPVVTAPGKSATHNQSFAASSLFSASDVDGDTMTAYQLWDSTADASSGRWVVGGIAKGSGVAIDITAAQLASTTFQSGSGSDDLYVRAYDGTAWSAWKQFQVNAPLDRAPVAASSNVTAARGQTSVAASSLFSVTDADGDTITRYALWDTEGSGRWVVNGVNQATNAEIVITAAQLAQTRYMFGSATNHLYVRAFDGTLWGNWTAFTASPFANTAPTVSASNLATARGQSLAASSMFTVSDVDGDTMTTYALWDSNTNGRFLVNGVAQSANTEISVSAAQLANTFYVSGSGTDQLYVRAFDGTAWSAWQAFTVAAPANQAPLVTAANAAIAIGHSVAASSLFAASDPNGDTITTYSFWDSNTNGHFTVNGVAQAANTEITVSAAQLSNTSYVAGSGTDQLYVRAFDGKAWSAWQAFTAGPTAPVVTAANAGVASGQSLPASGLFTASDPDGDAITQYALWDTEGSGRWVVNGVNQATNAEIVIAAAQLAQTSYVGGGGTDHLYVRALSGTTWSNWQAFTAGPTAPVVTASNAAVAAGQSRAASSLFAASDADGDVITQYALWDTEGSGRWVVNGVNQATNAEIVITAAQLAQTSYVGGSGTDHLYVRALSGTTWSAWQPFTAGPTAPVVTTSNLTTVPGQTIAASNLFSANDPDGSSLTAYAFWDADSNNGRFTVNGVAQAANTEISISAAQLANTSYIAGNGTDHLYVRAFDGTNWSSWQAFNATGSTPAIINAGATLELGSAYAGQVTFFGSTGTLKLDNSASFAGTVAGMTAQDAIDFADINFATIQTPTFSGTSAGGTLHVTDGVHTANIALLGNYLASTFVASSNGHGGTLIVDPPNLSSPAMLAITV